MATSDAESRIRQIYQQGQQVSRNGQRLTLEQAIIDADDRERDKLNAQYQREGKLRDEARNREDFLRVEGQRTGALGQTRPSMQSLAGGGAAGGGAAGSAAGPSYGEQWAREDRLRGETINREDRLRKEEQQRKDEMFGRITSLYGSPGEEISRTSGASFEQEQAARDAAFARAKEKAGQTARASMSTLYDVAAERGLTGSSAEAGQAGAIVGGAAGDIGEFLRDQAIGEADTATRRANLDYTGKIQQRGQNLSRQQAMMNLLTSGSLY